MRCDLIYGDCLEKMSDIPDGSVDMVCCDPPYGTIKGIASGEVIHGMKGKTKWDEIIDHKKMLSECNRILRTNGALLLFSQDPYTAKLMTETHGNLPFSYRYVWKKDHFANSLIVNKAPVNYTEDICVFFKRHPKYDFIGFHPLRLYAKMVCDFIGRTKKQIFSDFGNQNICHFMRHNSTQFLMCTETTYFELIKLYGIDKMDGFKSFYDLFETDRAYRIELISKMTADSSKIFNLPEGQKYKSNILEYSKDYGGLHPTQKPVALIEDLIRTYTNEGDLVLDFAAGSFTTAIACINLKRNFIGIEKDEKYFRIGQDRVRNEQAKLKLNL